MRILIDILLKDDVCEKLSLDKSKFYSQVLCKIKIVNKSKFKKVFQAFLIWFFFAFFNTNNAIYILNNMIYFVPWPVGYIIQHLEVQSGLSVTIKSIDLEGYLFEQIESCRPISMHCKCFTLIFPRPFQARR